MTAEAKLTDSSRCSYHIAGQDALRIVLQQGDRVCIKSVDGYQGVELLMLDPQGQLLKEANPECYPEYSPRPLQQSLQQYQAEGSSGARLRARLQAWGIDRAQLESGFSFAPEQLPSFSVCQDMVLIVLNCGADMQVTEQQPVTELLLEQQRLGVDDPLLPPPLAEPRSEFRISRCSALSYEVKAGEWIQVIDVAGRQCSDFVAFDAAALSEGREVALDATATRSLNGVSVPQPGLFSRLCDAEQRPMLELVQDSVGRHDSFLFACNARYYESQGYLGHINCSENFNRCLARFGIQPRAGWPAINFFFNTEAQACGEIGFAEPWSRAGDYVLMRASRDLVCASSACPDDIDPANGWNPTDIHIRIYPSHCEFPRSVGHRVIAEEPPRMTKPTGFHKPVSAAARTLSEYKGYWVADEYQQPGTVGEYLACRERVAMIDLSPLRKFEVLGPDAETLLQYALTRNVRRMTVGEVVYSALCHPTGGMVDDGTLFRLGQQAFRWICGDPYCGRWLQQLAHEQGWQVRIQDSTDQIHNLAVQGPQSRALLQQLIWSPECQPDLASLGWFRFLIGRLGGPDGMPLLVSRTGYTGELGYEVWCHPDQGESLWNAVQQAGEPYGIAPMGFNALDMLRIEAGLIFAGYEFCPETNPYEAGIGFTVPLKTKTEDFVGRAALESQLPASRKKLVGLLIQSQESVHHGDQVYQGRFPIGVVTSAVFSPLLQQQIALCRIAPQYAETGTAVEVGQLDGQQKRLPASVTTLPFYDPERSRVRS